jgi:Fe/S biogenesis protein NfuA
MSTRPQPDHVADRPVVLSEQARARIRAALEAADPPRRHLRIRVGAQDGRLVYQLQGLTEDQVEGSDIRIEEDGFTLVVDADSVERLRGTRIDYRETLVERGFRFDNPNASPAPALPGGDRPDLQGSLPDRVRMLLDSEINPAIAAHGGRVQLVDVREGRVYLAFGGGCHGCGMVDVTLKQGIERRIREAVPEVAGVIDTTDHSTGENPYF